MRCEQAVLLDGSRPNSRFAGKNERVETTERQAGRRRYSNVDIATDGEIGRVQVSGSSPVCVCVACKCNSTVWEGVVESCGCPLPSRADSSLGTESGFHFFFFFDDFFLFPLAGAAAACFFCGICCCCGGGALARLILICSPSFNSSWRRFVMPSCSGSPVSSSNIRTRTRPLHMMSRGYVLGSMAPGMLSVAHACAICGGGGQQQLSEVARRGGAGRGARRSVCVRARARG